VVHTLNKVYAHILIEMMNWIFKNILCFSG
jgi:hypothetical protein